MKRTLILLFLICLLGFTASFAAAADDYILPNEAGHYLEFNNTADIAISDTYTAVLTDTAVIVQDRATGKVRTAQPAFLQDIGAHEIYTDDSYVYVRSDYDIYYADFETLSFSKSGIYSGNRFAVLGEYIITATSARIRLYNLQTEELLDNQTLSDNSIIPFVYFTGNGQEFGYKLNEIDTLKVSRLAAAANGDIYFISGGGIYKEFSDTPLIADLHARAIKYYSGKIYIACTDASGKDKILAYDILKGKFEDYEIGSSSSSSGRLYNAADIDAQKDRLYIADSGNNRIVVTDRQGTFIENIALNFSPLQVSASGGNLVAVSSDGAFVIDVKTAEITASITGKFVSVAAASEHFYLLEPYSPTESAAVRTFLYDGNKLSDRALFPTTIKPEKIAADVSGDLYAALSGGKVMRYSGNITDALLDKGEEAAAFGADGQGILKLIVDIAFMPALLTADGTVHYGNESFVLPKRGNNTVSFSYYGDSSNVYLLYSDAVIKADSPALSTVDNIDVPEFSLPDELELLALNARSLIFSFDLNTPHAQREYVWYSTSSDLAVIKLYETSTHIIFTGSVTGICAKSSFKAYLGEAVTELSLTGYAAVGFNAYKLPALQTALTDLQTGFLAGEQVTVTGAIWHDDLHCPFYILQTQDGLRYVPQSFITQFYAPLSPDAQNFKSAYLGENGGALYSDNQMTAEIAALKGGAKVYIYSQGSGIAHIFTYIDGQFVEGYIDSSQIAAKGKDTLRNVLIILLLMLSVCATTLFYLKTKKSKL